MDTVRHLLTRHLLAQRILAGDAEVVEPPQGVGPSVLSPGFYVLYTGPSGKLAAQAARAVLEGLGTVRLVDRLSVSNIDLVVALHSMRPFEVVLVDKRRRIQARVDAPEHLSAVSAAVRGEGARAGEGARGG